MKRFSSSEIKAIAKTSHFLDNNGLHEDADLILSFVKTAGAATDAVLNQPGGGMMTPDSAFWLKT